MPYFEVLLPIPKKFVLTYFYEEELQIGVRVKVPLVKKEEVGLIYKYSTENNFTYEIKNIIEVKGIDRIHIGLNDLHLGMGLDFMFELLSGGIVEYLSDTIKYKDIKFGFGGIAKIGQGDVPAEIIIGEHYRLNSQSVILSREFREKVIHQDFTNNLIKEIKKIRDIEGKIKTWSEIDFARNREEVIERVNEVVSKKQRIYNEKK